MEPLHWPVSVLVLLSTQAVAGLLLSMGPHAPSTQPSGLAAGTGQLDHEPLNAAVGHLQQWPTCGLSDNLCRPGGLPLHSTVL